MSAFALSLVIAAALLHSIWNIAAKKAGGDDRFALSTAALLVVIWAPVLGPMAYVLELYAVRPGRSASWRQPARCRCFSPRWHLDDPLAPPCPLASTLRPLEAP